MSLPQLVNVVAQTLYLAIFGRIILSWVFPQGSTNPIYTFVYSITEPILAPLRRVLPRLGMFDLTPLVAILLIMFVSSLLGRLI